MRRRAWEDPCQALGELCADAALCAQLALPRRDFIQLHRCSQVRVMLAYVHKWASPEATVVHSAVKILQGCGCFIGHKAAQVCSTSFAGNLTWQELCMLALALWILSAFHECDRYFSSHV